MCFAERAGARPGPGGRGAGQGTYCSRFPQARLWEDPPAYYDPPEGLLRYEPDVPAHLASRTASRSVSGHIRLVEHQLAQIGRAFTLAYALGRKLILPRITCGYDKAWYGLDHGVFSGAPQ